MKHDFHHTAVWYNRNVKLWVLQRLDAAGNQIGDADYFGVKESAVWCEEMDLIARYKEAYRLTALRDFVGDINYRKGWFQMTGHSNVRKNEFIAMTMRLIERIK